MLHQKRFDRHLALFSGRFVAGSAAPCPAHSCCAHKAGRRAPALPARSWSERCEAPSKEPAVTQGGNQPRFFVTALRGSTGTALDRQRACYKTFLQHFLSSAETEEKHGFSAFHLFLGLNKIHSVAVNKHNTFPTAVNAAFWGFDHIIQLSKKC